MNYPHGNPYYLECIRVPFCGPPFFLFINDTPATNITTLFADYSKLIGNARSPATIQTDLHCLSQWADVWQMKFNESKCSVLHIGKDNPKNNYIMGHTPLQVVEKERDLGVVVSAGDTLCWEEHIRRMIGKQNKWRLGSLEMLYLGNKKC